MRRLLICDDDAELAEVMGEFLRDEGLDCVVAMSLDDVKRQRERALSCDVAFLDVNLGSGQPDGLEVYRWLRSQHFAGSVVFLTGHAITNDKVTAMRASGVSVLSKPVPADTLVELARHGAQP